jgi:ribosomal protein L44E
MPVETPIKVTADASKRYSKISQIQRSFVRVKVGTGVRERAVPIKRNATITNPANA